MTRRGNMRLVNGCVELNGVRWPYDATTQAVRDAEACMESRRTCIPCDCTCCDVWSLFRALGYEMHRVGSEPRSAAAPKEVK